MDMMQQHPHILEVDPKFYQMYAQLLFLEKSHQKLKYQIADLAMPDASEEEKISRYSNHYGT